MKNRFAAIAVCVTLAVAVLTFAVLRARSSHSSHVRGARLISRVSLHTTMGTIRSSLFDGAPNPNLAALVRSLPEHPEQRKCYGKYVGWLVQIAASIGLRPVSVRADRGCGDCYSHAADDYCGGGYPCDLVSTRVNVFSGDPATGVKSTTVENCRFDAMYRPISYNVADCKCGELT